MAARRLFGHEVVFVRFEGRALFNGAMSGAMPGVIFLNVDSKAPLMAVLGHELLRQLAATSPAIYDELNCRLDGLLNNEQRYIDRLDAKSTPEQRKGLKYGEELHGDITGDFFTDRVFW